MNTFSHFYPRYGLALALRYANAADISDLDSRALVELLEDGLNHYRLKAQGVWLGQDSVTYTYARILEGNTASGVYLSPSVIVQYKSAKSLWTMIESFQEKLSNNYLKKVGQAKESAKQTYAPTSGEYNNGKASRQTATISLFEAVCCAIVTTTPLKPCYIHMDSNGMSNTTIIPDLPLNDLRKFITLFEVISKKRVDPVKSMTGSINKEKNKPNRPGITHGNFPHAPRSNALKSLGLLGAIGEWAKESELSAMALEVLSSLESCPIYIINPDGTKVTSYNHFIVRLAKEQQLNAIIDAIYFVRPFVLTRDSDFKQRSREQEKVAFFASRFLHLFDEMSFREFLAIRAEYPYHLEPLFNIFFMEQKQIDPQIVSSARALGSWLNYVAYKVAVSESNDKNSIRDFKAKVLVELESSAFAAKSGTALIGQTVTRAGRLFNSDAPAEAGLFMEKTMSGELGLKDAQQMLMAFSRLSSKIEPKETASEVNDNDFDIVEQESDYNDAR